MSRGWTPRLTWTWKPEARRGGRRGSRRRRPSASPSSACCSGSPWTAGCWSPGTCMLYVVDPSFCNFLFYRETTLVFVVLCVRAWDADVLLYEDRDFCNLYSTNYFENVSWCLSYRHLLQCTVFKTERGERKIESLGILQNYSKSNPDNLVLLCLWTQDTSAPAQQTQWARHVNWTNL